ncbi:MAG: phosphoadenylyl-sulfate reductase [Planctomycetota bacterium]
MSLTTPAAPPTAARRDPRQVLAWAAESFGDDVVLASALGDASLVVLDVAHELGLDLPVVFLDTGLHFPETLQHLARVERHFGITIDRVEPPRTVQEQERDEGAALWQRDPDRCCALRKVGPLDAALEGRRAWISGLLRSGRGPRAETSEIEWDVARRMVKINPLASWTRTDVVARLVERGVPRNPLRDQGYASVGCAPCTHPASTDDERSGRWVGFAKTECGLHAGPALRPAEVTP